MIHSAPSCSVGGHLTSAVVPVEAQMYFIVTRPHFSSLAAGSLDVVAEKSLPDLGS